MPDDEESQMTALAAEQETDFGTEAVKGELLAILDSLPESNSWRAEILDGENITVSPCPSGAHDRNIRAIERALDPYLPEGMDYAGNLEIRVFEPERVVVPDLFVAPVDVLTTRKNWVSPNDVVLAIEVVSPGSRRNDRFLKLARYAEMSIPCYLLVDQLEACTVVFSRPKGGEYQDTAKHEFGATFKLSDPFEAEIDSSSFIPYD
ncbi:Uma2 family endonuclease [Nocardiopsis halophila]|uniref:Uma2 family endonuclease n=1 Tax=Nocardiopsis halophila TaxID=141692 RepID=UPI000345A67B|nr:Uma2 family endonuclease [Nocardiopsis halophila]